MKIFYLLFLILSIFSYEKNNSTKKTSYNQNNISTSISYNEDYTIKIGVVNDEDGYTNIRLKPNSKSSIVGTISEKEYFFYTPSKQNNWFSVKTLNGINGYVYKNRITNINNKEQICATINSIDPSDDSYDKDTIINISSLDKKTPFIIKKLMYPKIKLKEKLEEKITFLENDIKIEISKSKFNSESYNIVKEDSITIVKDKNGADLYGSYSNPNYVFKNIIITHNKKEYTIPNNTFYNLLEPSLEQVNIYKKSNKQIIISMVGAINNASENYNILFILDEGKLLKKYVYRQF